MAKQFKTVIIKNTSTLDMDIEQKSNSLGREGWRRLDVVRESERKAIIQYVKEA
ncbi:MAG: hypothetical protein ACRC20_12355 [Segniliparus sp.]|uniref:hypothetical protein n=1 Tax=Segniliparus sp. TaxID=2804064 RepID=UPI003F35A9C9